MCGPATTVQTCVVQLIRNTFRLSARQHWDALKRDLKPIYNAPGEPAARAEFDDLAEHWGPVPGDRSAVEQRVGRVHHSWTMAPRYVES